MESWVHPPPRTLGDRRGIIQPQRAAKSLGVWGKGMAPARQGLRSREDTQPVPRPAALLSRCSHLLNSHAPRGPRPRDMQPSFQRCSGLKPLERLLSAGLNVNIPPGETFKDLCILRISMLLRLRESCGENSEPTSPRGLVIHLKHRIHSTTGARNSLTRIRYQHNSQFSCLS